MFRRTGTSWFIAKIFSVSKPPTAGYEIAELPNEKVLRDFMQHYRTKGVLVILHSGLTAESKAATAVAETAATAAAAGAAAATNSPSISSSPSTAHPAGSGKRPAATSAGGHASSAAVASTSPAASVPFSAITHDPVTRSFISSINAVNLGNPEEVKLALVPGPAAPSLVDEYNIITYPTTLLFMDGACVFRCVGARTRELSIKSLFMLRNAGRNVFSRA